MVATYPPLVPPLPQHPDEKHYQFATPSTLKPTQIKCSEGSINQIPAWTEIKGDVRLTPFYNIHDCMKKFEGYVQELNNGESCDESSDHVTSLATRRQRRRRHLKSGQATTNKRSLVHVHGVGGLQQAMCSSKNYLWNQNVWVPMQSSRATLGF